MEFAVFWESAWGNLPLLLACGMVLAVIWVNGWTDAAGAIATVVSSGALGERPAVVLAALCNLLGVGVMTALCPTVAQTMQELVDFGPRPSAALTALAAALFAVLLWATVCWVFGLPTSESHGLIAGLTGAALALGQGLSALNPAPWAKAALGLAFSSLAGLVGGFLCARLAGRLPFREGSPFFRRAQIFGAAAMAFFHGAQDGQKFLALFLLALSLGNPGFSGAAPLWLLVLCACLMGLGTACGGGRIIRTVGVQMVQLSPSQGFGADLAGAVCLLFSCLWGLPVSTTHVKTVAMMGAGSAAGRGEVDKSTVRELFLAWGLTFPACLLLGYLAARAALILL